MSWSKGKVPFDDIAGSRFCTGTRGYTTGGEERQKGDEVDDGAEVLSFELSTTQSALE